MRVPRDNGVGGLARALCNGVPLMVTLWLVLPIAVAEGGEALVLEDFRSNDGQGFPVGWEAQRSKSKAQESYQVDREGKTSFLTGKEAGQRVFKRIAWDPRAMPVVTWRWRLKTPPPTGGEPIAALYVSLDTDLLVIPVATKYVWSLGKAKGTMTEGGLFGASEVVLRTGPEPVGEWLEERVNAYEDFKRIHQHEPAAQAWGISLLAGPGVEVDFGEIAVSAP